MHPNTRYKRTGYVLMLHLNYKISTLNQSLGNDNFILSLTDTELFLPTTEPSNDTIRSAPVM